jgi:orotate phosphoribosyltransferase-like protein
MHVFDKIYIIGSLSKQEIRSQSVSLAMSERMNISPQFPVDLLLLLNRSVVPLATM